MVPVIKRSTLPPHTGSNPDKRCLSVNLVQQPSHALNKLQVRGRHQLAAHGAVGCPAQHGQASTDAMKCTMQATQDCVTHQLCSHVPFTVWDYIDAGVAYFFGLDESKYQWAIDRHNQLLAQVSCCKGHPAMKTHQCQQSCQQDQQQHHNITC